MRWGRLVRVDGVRGWGWKTGEIREESRRVRSAVVGRWLG